MAFVSRAGKQNYLDQGAKYVTPGPGAYFDGAQYQAQRSCAPFNSTTGRDKQSKKEENTAPGPGAYNISIDATGGNHTQKLLVSSLNPDPRELEAPTVSNIFKSKTQRFSPAVRKDETPGPGSYNYEEPIGKRIRMIPGASATNQGVSNNILKSKQYVSIPSIPSNLHGYGYTENERILSTTK